MREEWIEVYGAGGLNYEFGRLTYHIVKPQTVETVERIIRPIGRDDREDVELLATLFNVDGAEEGIYKGWRFSGIKDVPSCKLDGIGVMCGRGGRREYCVCDGSIVWKWDGGGQKFVGKVDGWWVLGQCDGA
jgi:hypothetical protein